MTRQRPLVNGKAGNGFCPGAIARRTATSGKLNRDRKSIQQVPARDSTAECNNTEIDATWTEPTRSRLLLNFHPAHQGGKRKTLQPTIEFPRTRYKQE
ncbi:MAG: hypothetical protein SW833_16110 [Cyanobacteriota bacterium]|nr:hypothetical protein [Cyanobacteriota bacterium]